MMENGADVEEVAANIDQLFPRCRGSKIKTSKSKKSAINVGEIIELSQCIDDANTQNRPKIFSDKMLSPVRKANLVVSCNDDKDDNNTNKNDDDEEVNTTNAIATPKTTTTAGERSTSKIGIAGGREVYSMSRSRFSRHPNKSLKNDSTRTTASLSAMSNDNNGSNEEGNSNGSTRSSKCVISLVPPRPSTESSAPTTTLTSTTKRVIGGVPIANYEGSPRRYKPKESNNTTSNVSTPKSKCSSASSTSSKGNGNGNTSLCLPGFPIRVTNADVGSIINSEHKEHGNNDADENNEDDELPPPPASFYDYAYEFSETRKVLDDFFAKDNCKVKNDANANNDDEEEANFIDLNYKLVRRPQQERDKNQYYDHVTHALSPDTGDKGPKSQMKKPTTTKAEELSDDDDLDLNSRRSGVRVNHSSSTSLMPVLADGLSSPDTPNSDNDDEDEDLVLSSSGSVANKTTPDRVSGCKKSVQSPRDSLADVAIVEEHGSYEDGNDSPTFPPPPPPSFPSLTLDDLGIEPPPLNTDDSFVERTNDSPASDPWSNPPAHDNDEHDDDADYNEDVEDDVEDDIEDDDDVVEERVPTPKTMKEDDLDTDQETDRLLGEQYKEGSNGNNATNADKNQNEALMKKRAANGSASSRGKEGDRLDSSVLIEGVLFRARYLGSTQLVCEGQPTKTTRMMQAEEAVSRIKTPNGESQPSTDVDLFISTEKIMVLNTDLKEIMMDHSLRSISYIADIGDLLVVMARRRVLAEEEQQQVLSSAPKMLCHVFESEEAQFIAQSIGQAFQVAYVEFLKANGIEDHAFVKEMDYQEVLNSQEIFGDELNMFAKKELQKEVVVPKAKGEILGVVIVESGWGSMLPTIVLANLSPSGPAARCGLLNIGDQIIAINGVSLVGLPLSTCQNYIKNTKNKTAVKLTAVSCPPVVEVKIKRPDTKYQLGFSVQNGVICSLLRGGIAERGGVRVGHRIIEINGQSVVAVPHERIVNLLATSVGEISMKTMPTSMFRLLTGQETPLYI